MQAFEKSLQRLEEIVEQLESNEIELEKALTLFEEGIKLTKECNSILEKAEGRIKELMQDDIIEEQAITEE